MKVHKRRRQMFLDLAEEEAHRFAVIDGSKDLDQVETAIRSGRLQRHLRRS